jgi:hypothetical protein
LFAPSVMRKTPAIGWPRLRATIARRASPIAVCWPCAASRSTHSAFNGSVGRVVASPAADWRNDAAGISVTALLNANVSTLYSFASRGIRLSLSLCRTVFTRSSRDTFSSPGVAVRVWFSPFSGSSTPLAIAARFRSSVSTRGSSTFILVLESTSTTISRRTLLSITNAYTGRRSIATISSRKIDRSVASTYRFHAGTSGAALR